MAQLTRILIVDDSARTRVALRHLLMTWPEIMIVGEAANGQDAVGLVAASRPDVVLMDLEMPVLDGVAAIRLIKQQWPAVAVVALTMYAAQQAPALAAGADAFVIKGSGADQLLAALGLGTTPSNP